jgi:hypothetical protein
MATRTYSDRMMSRRNFGGFYTSSSSLSSDDGGAYSSVALRRPVRKSF